MYRFLTRILKLIVTIIAACVMIVSCIILYLFLHIDNKLTVAKYEIEGSVENEILIVQLTDLHEAEFGTHNEELCKLVKKSNPDIIVLTGDMQNRDDPNIQVVETLVRNLVAIAPVYYGYGNHEDAWEKKYGEELRERIVAAGAVVLEKNFIDTVINGNNIRLGGYMGYYHFPGMLTKNQEVIEQDNRFFEDFENTSDYKILLNHIPTQWVDWKYLDEYDVDLVLCGHYHGGQWVLPIVGPIYAPYVEWFPKNVKGVFKGDKTTCVLSTGLDNEYKYVPRVNNPAEVVVIELT